MDKQTAGSRGVSSVSCVVVWMVVSSNCDTQTHTFCCRVCFSLPRLTWLLLLAHTFFSDFIAVIAQWLKHVWGKTLIHIPDNGEWGNNWQKWTKNISSDQNYPSHTMSCMEHETQTDVNFHDVSISRFYGQF